MTQNLNQAAGRVTLDLKTADLGAGNFGKKGFFVFNDLPGNGGTGLPWISADVVKHGAEVFVGAIEKVKIFLGSIGGREKATKPHGVVGQSAAISNIAALTAVLEVGGGAPRVKLSQGSDASADGIEGFDRSAGAKKHFESFDSLPFGLGPSGEGRLGGVNRSPLNQIG